MGGELLNELLARELARRQEARQARRRLTVEPLDSTHVRLDGRVFLNFASNDYLGLTHHPRVVAAAREASARYGAGSGASGLISGYTAAHAAAEQAIAAWKGSEAAVLMPSGYQCAHAVVQTLTGAARTHPEGIRFLMDKLCHASLIDAVGGADMRVFAHNYLNKLERLLAEGSPGQLQVVITESIFSMDGDAADLEGLAALKRKYPFVLVLDEAHGSGVYGPGGAGYAAERGLQSAVDVSIVTLSKAVGVAGGVACGSRRFCEALVNWGRAYIYSTSVPASVAAAAMAAIEVMRDEPQRQRRVRALAKRVREALRERGLEVVQGDSPIIPVILGEEELAVKASERLREMGLLVWAIRPPTVPRGSSRLRVTLSCEHGDEEVGRLVEGVGKASGKCRMMNEE